MNKIHLWKIYAKLSNLGSEGVSDGTDYVGHKIKGLILWVLILRVLLSDSIKDEAM